MYGASHGTILRPHGWFPNRQVFELLAFQSADNSCHIIDPEGLLAEATRRETRNKRRQCVLAKRWLSLPIREVLSHQVDHQPCHIKPKPIRYAVKPQTQRYACTNQFDRCSVQNPFPITDCVNLPSLTSSAMQCNANADPTQALQLCHCPPAGAEQMTPTMV